MFGWRGRIGLILPIDNIVMEPELYGLQIEGVSFHSVRLTTKERRKMPDQAIVLAPAFVELGVDLVVYACAETSFLGDSDDHGRVRTEIEQSTRLPCITAVGAMVEALKALSVQRISLVTPYTAVRTQVMREYLTSFGIETVHHVQKEFIDAGGDQREWYHTNRQPARMSYQMAREAFRESAEAVLISATNFRTLSMIQELERDLDRPVVTINQAILWSALRRLGINTPIPGLGRLFNH